MLILPAIDILDGQCVRLEQGDFDRKTVFSKDPIEIAAAWKDAGATFVHVVDLDGARSGRPRNLALVSKIVSKTGIRVQLGGGIRSREVLEEAFSVGVDRVVLGTAALSSPAFVGDAARDFPGRIVAGVDVRKGLVAVEGWTRTAAKPAIELVREMKDLGIEEFVYTDVKRDGMLAGPDLDGVRNLLSTGARVIVSGGVSSIDDIKRLKLLEKEGLAGVIIGRALYTGRVSLEEALRIARSRESESSG